MGRKGDETRELIKAHAYELFAARGYKEVTMKDICEASGLSRGGLYRHFSGTRELLEELFQEAASDVETGFERSMREKMDARLILHDLLKQLKSEMLDSNRSLSLAIFEYAQVVDHDFFAVLNQRGKERWQKLLRYGMQRGEFKDVDAEAVSNLILYSYQGVRMWSVVTPVGEETAEHITALIKGLLIKGSKDALGVERGSL